MIDISGATGRLKAVYDYLVANLSVARAAKIDNLDAVMPSASKSPQMAIASPRSRAC